MQSDALEKEKDTRQTLPIRANTDLVEPPEVALPGRALSRKANTEPSPAASQCHLRQSEPRLKRPIRSSCPLRPKCHLCRAEPRLVRPIKSPCPPHTTRCHCRGAEPRRSELCPIGRIMSSFQSGAKCKALSRPFASSGKTCQEAEST